MRIAATVIVFGPDEKPWLLAEVARRYQDWRRTHPGSTVGEFLKADGLLFHRPPRSWRTAGGARPRI